MDYYGSINDVMVLGEYNFLQDLLKQSGEPPIVIDAGANIGAFAIFVLEARPDAIVHSLELSQTTYELLKRNANLAQRRSWKVHNLALWKEDGSVPFADDPSLSAASRIVTGKQEKSAAAISLETLHRDLVGGKRIFLLKMDIEGAEEAVLNQSAALLNEVDHFIIEIHHHEVDTDQIMAILGRYFKHIHVLEREDEDMPLVFASHSHTL